MPNQWVIPDIHGCFHTLKNLLENHIRPSKDDELFFLGDLIDRGKHSKEVLDYLIDLEHQGFTVKAIKGNHETYFLNAFKNETTFNPSFLGKKHSKAYLFWMKFGGKETLDSFGVKTTKDIPEHYVHWIEKLPYYYVTDHYVMVHAGLNFSIKNPFEDTDFMLINTQFTVIPEKIGNRIVIHGHIPLSMEGIETLIKERETYHFICLDNGCYYENIDTYGSLLALHLNSLQLVSQPNIDE